MADAGEDRISLPTGPSGASFALQGVGLAAGVVPFFCHYRSVSTVNGEVVSYLDYVALLGAVVAIGIGAYGLWGARYAGDKKTRVIAVAAVSVLLGVVQLALGFGVLARLA